MLQRANIFIILVTFFWGSIATAANTNKVTLELSAGSLKLEELISSYKEIAESTPSKFINKEVAGKIITINGKKYEIRYFSFEDTSGKLPENMTFKEYASKNGILDMQSVKTAPLAGIEFESFDFRRAALDDGVYFSMAIRLQ